MGTWHPARLNHNTTTVQMAVAQLSSSVSSHEDLLPQDLLHHVGFISPVIVLNVTWIIQLFLMVLSSHYHWSLAKSRAPRDVGADSSARSILCINIASRGKAG